MSMNSLATACIKKSDQLFNGMQANNIMWIDIGISLISYTRGDC